MKALITALLPIFLSGCGNMNIKDFSQSPIAFDLFDYFEGTTRAWGLFEDRFGKVRRQFTVDIQGHVNGDTLVLEEYFEYQDGEQQQRSWTITRTGENTYSGTAADVIGSARGEISGNALHWTYRLSLPVGDRHWKVDFDDWMFLQPDGTLLNRARVRKFGFEIGSVTLAFMKDPQQQTVAGSASQ